MYVTLQYSSVSVLHTCACAQHHFRLFPPGVSGDGSPVFLRDVWPSREEIQATERAHVIPSMFRDVYARVTTGNAAWSALDAPDATLYPWDAKSTYIKSPPFFDTMVRSLCVCVCVGVMFCGRLFEELCACARFGSCDSAACKSNLLSIQLFTHVQDRPAVRSAVCILLRGTSFQHHQKCFSLPSPPHKSCIQTSMQMCLFVFA